MAHDAQTPKVGEFPSTEAMKAAVELEIKAAVGRVTTRAIGALIDKVADDAGAAALAVSRNGVSREETAHRLPTRDELAHAFYDATNRIIAPKLYPGWTPLPLEEDAAALECHYAYAEAALALVAAPRAEDETEVGWQPIEKAPKDGTVLILFARHVNATASIPMFGWFCSSGGWIAMSFADQPVAKVVPSHWMPRDILPSWPASLAGKGAGQECGR